MSDIAFLAFCPYCDWIDTVARGQLSALRAADHHIGREHPRTLLARRNFEAELAESGNLDFALDQFDATMAVAS